jgi:D-glycerate 3-kinase
MLWPEKLKVPVKNTLDLNRLEQVFQSVLDDEAIAESDAIYNQFHSLYFPLSCWLNSKVTNEPYITGINGAQGSGKTTTVKIVKALLENAFGLNVLALSIDDLYLTKKQRQQLAIDEHILLQTRGVPGTHDTTLGLSIFQKLKDRPFKSFQIPIFDKSIDDRVEDSLWLQITQQVDIVLFEGWCVGAIAQDPINLSQAVNTLEEDEDKNAVWRNFVNDQLENKYKQLFSNIDLLIMLKVPSMEKVYDWRLLQEQKMRESLSLSQIKKVGMSDKELKRFIMHYERITRSTLYEMPGRADIVLQIDDSHQISSVIKN